MSAPGSVSGTRPAGPPFHRFDAEAPAFERMHHEAVSRLATEAAGQPVVVAAPAEVLALTAQQPYDLPHGNVDVYKPARWDTSANLIFMDSIRQVGPSPGQWEGSVAYAEFKPASSGTFLVVCHFTGYQTTMHLRGPWGETTAYTAETSDSGAVLAQWTGDQRFEFTMTCTVPNNDYGLGYIESILVYAIA